MPPTHSIGLCQSWSWPPRHRGSEGSTSILKLSRSSPSLSAAQTQTLTQNVEPSSFQSPLLT
jgi:hypothetical protein